MLNKVMIIGRLGADPELRYAATGMAVCRFNVATDEAYTDQSGQRQERTEWHRIVVFSKQAENCANYLFKGSLVYVEGALSTSKWTDQQGQTRYTTEIKAQRVQFLDRKGDRPAPSADDAYSRPQQTRRDDDDLGPAFPSEAGGMDDVPF
ncbi:MAG: single-stranded DNA-binding protein [Desulfovibrionaceae bacterium]|nr:single-stranded DNA-binding protein [Desulfovibrionaceae bacterium]